MKYYLSGLANGSNGVWDSSQPASSVAAAAHLHASSIRCHSPHCICIPHKLDKFAAFACRAYWLWQLQLASLLPSLLQLQSHCQRDFVVVKRLANRRVVCLATSDGLRCVNAATCNLQPVVAATRCSQLIMNQTNERTSWCCCGINNAMFKRWVYWRHLHEIIIKCCRRTEPV